MTYRELIHKWRKRAQEMHLASVADVAVEVSACADELEAVMMAGLLSDPDRRELRTVVDVLEWAKDAPFGASVDENAAYQDVVRTLTRIVSGSECDYLHEADVATWILDQDSLLTRNL